MCVCLSSFPVVCVCVVGSFVVVRVCLIVCLLADFRSGYLSSVPSLLFLLSPSSPPRAIGHPGDSLRRKGVYVVSLLDWYRIHVTICFLNSL